MKRAGWIRASVFWAARCRAVMTGPDPTTVVDFVAERWIAAPVDRVWLQCTTPEGIERWWSPEDLRTTVKRFDPRPGGEVLLTMRYVPAMLGAGRDEAFKAAGVPIGFVLRGRVLEAERYTRLVVELTLSLDRAGAGITTTTGLEFAAAGDRTHVTLHARGATNPHWVTLGQANLEGQLHRLGQSAERPGPTSGDRDSPTTGG